MGLDDGFIIMIAPYAGNGSYDAETQGTAGQPSMIRLLISMMIKMRIKIRECTTHGGFVVPDMASSYSLLLLTTPSRPINPMDDRLAISVLGTCIEVIP